MIQILELLMSCVSFCSKMVPREGVEPSEPGLEGLVPNPLDERNLW